MLARIIWLYASLGGVNKTVVKEEELLVFVSCSPGKEEVEKLKDEREVLSIYHVCGSNPWLIVCKTNSIEKLIELSQRHDLDAKYMSIASTTTRYCCV